METTKGYTNSETYTLPSKGMLYDVSMDPEVELRAMTTEEELRRLSPSDTPNRVLCNLIEDCMVTKPKIHVYDMCVGDYEFLLHKLRVVTYGPEYKMVVKCPNCEEIVEVTTNLDDISISEYDETVDAEKVITLPDCGKEIELRVKTPRVIDEIIQRAKEIKRKTKGTVDQTYVLTLQSMIKKIDGNVPSQVALEQFVRNMKMRDANYLEQKYEAYNGKVGVDGKLVCKCTECGYEFLTSFRLTNEFFRPSID